MNKIDDSNKTNGHGSMLKDSLLFVIIGLILAISLSTLIIQVTSKQTESECKHDKLAIVAQQFTFEQIKTLLFAGKKIRIVFDYQKLSHYINNELQEKSTNAVNGLSIEDYEYFSVNVVQNPIPYIATSSAVLVTHARYGIIYNYGKIRIYEDDRIEISVIYIDVQTTTVVLDNNKYNSTLPTPGVFITVEE
jgi:hypothetical protein